MRHALQRSAYAASLMAATVLFSFLLFQLVPTDPARIALGANASDAQVAALRQQLGLDLPLVKQFATYITNVLSGDLGRSFVDGRLVSQEVGSKFLLSAALTTLASLLAAMYLLAQVTFSRNGNTPAIFSLLNNAFTALPTMFIAILALRWVFADYPFSYYPGTLFALEGWGFMLPPAIVLAFYPMGILGKIAEREFDRLANQPFVLAARARGIDEQGILWRYLFPNSLITLLSSYTTLLPLLLTGSFIIEIMFSVPGLGSLLLKAVLNRDLPMLQGIVIVATMFTVLIHLLIELAYPAIDPRIAEQRFA